jgi:serine/threonine protein kinase
MAPEVFEGDYDYGCDVWALGIIYLELLTGKRVSELIGYDKVPAKIEGFPSEEELACIQDEKYRELVRKMLARNPKDRIGIQ